ncbi:MAG: translation elongation factor Ts [Anaerolineales bacterium]|nr:translation elongation factor Ts [Anaerolineales bacterium]
MTISTQQIKDLREATGAGMLDCKKALESSDGDYEKALEFLREKGMSKAEKRSDREASNGMIDLYSHGDGRVGVMVEVNCETDFVARTEQFRVFAHEIALQVAAASPRWIQPEDVPEDLVVENRAAAAEMAAAEGKPDNIIERIVEGKLAKFYDENCLLRQEYIRDDSKTVEDLLKENIVSTGEKIVIRRFARWELGEAEE